MLPIRTILHPTDFSNRSEDAFQAACSLARDHGARVVVLYVRAPTLIAGAFGEPGPMVPDPVQTPADVKEKIVAMHPLDPALDIEFCVGEGDPAVEIVRMARAMVASLIVMGTHGRSGISRLLMGSVAEAVLRKAPCPVLTLKAPFFVGAAVPAAPAREPAAV
jgi:nucleotide-binding universal stress UspA family protein